MDKTKKIKALVIGDDWVRAEHLVEATKEVLAGYDYEIESFEQVLDKPMSREKKEDIGGDDVITEYNGCPQDLINRIEGVNLLVVHTAPVSKPVIEAGKDLLAIGCCRSDPVSLNVAAATEKRIYVFNTPGRSAEPVSDLTITLALTMARNIIRADKYVKSGKWNSDINREEPIWDEFMTFRGPTLKGKKFGIVGLGKIGKLVAKKAAGLGMDVQIYDPFLAEETIKKYGTSRQLEELFTISDFVTIHVPPVLENVGLVSRELFNKMKPTAFFINVARGEIIDEKALIEVLKEKKIAGAALDVYLREPLENESELRNLDNVILTPHIAGQRNDVSEGSASILREQMRPFFQENSLDTCLNIKK